MKVSSFFFALLVQCSHASAVLGGKAVTPEMKIAQSTVGITTVSKNNYPTVELALENVIKYPSTTCTGTLIGPQLIITAAHCLRWFNWEDEFTFVIFGHDFSPLLSPKPQPILIDKKISHKDFNTNAAKNWNDIALLRMAQPAPVGFVPVKYLKDANEAAKSSKVIISGYGRWDININRWGQKLYYSETSFDDLDYSETEAELGRDGRRSCTGDSGGPVYIENENDDLVLIGVISRARDFDLHCSTSTIFPRPIASLTG